MARIVFMGTPAFAVPTLRALMHSGEYTVVGVVTQPDRPVGRGRQVRPSPVTQVAHEHGLPLIQPAGLRKDPAAVEQLRAWSPDVIAVAAFGQILRREVLDIPSHGCLNVHASLLPRWRGAAPINHAILAGDEVTGVSIMQIQPGLDDGPVLLSASLPIRPEDTTATLGPRLAELGAELLLAALPGWLAGTLRATPQDESRVTLAPPLEKEQGRLDWSRPAATLERQVRACDPWPGTFTTWQGRALKILRASRVPPGAGPAAAPGEVVALDRGLAVGTGDGLLRLEQVQLEGKRAVLGTEFVRGYAQVIGSRMGA